VLFKQHSTVISIRQLPFKKISKHFHNIHHPKMVKNVSE